MTASRPSALQIAFLTFAWLLLAVPMSQFLVNALEVKGVEAAVVTKVTPFAVAILLALAFPGVRRECVRLLSQPIPLEKRRETTLAAVAALLIPFAAAGALALWWWLSEGSAALEQRMTQRPPEKDLHDALSSAGILRTFVFAAVIGPVIEEILFRGILYEALERRWGWLVSTLLTAILFGLYHPYFISAFVASLFFSAVYLRVGSLRAAILAHGVVNLSLWYPFLGQFVMLPPQRAVGDIGEWGLQLAALFVVAVGLPIYLWLARQSAAEAADTAAAPA